MGIKNLYQFIQKYAPNSIKLNKIDKYQNKTIGIDANLMLYKLIYGIRAQGYDLQNNNIIITHIHSLLLKLIAFKKYNITPIFVYDNMPPEIKYKTLDDRKKIKKKLVEKYKDSITDRGKRILYYIKSDITQKEIEDCKKLIDIFGYVSIDAKEEADAQLAYLYREKIIDYIASDDLDILVFGGNKIIKKFSIAKSKNNIEIDLDKLLEESKLTKNQLIDMSILMGSDYCDNKPMSFNKAYKIIKEYKTLNNIPKEIFNYNYEKAKKYFKNPPVYKIEKITCSGKINKEKLIKFLEEFKFSQEYIDKYISKLNE
jgi:flap endonuclease-1